TPGGKRLTQKAKICYARVSSENLRQHYSEYEIVALLERIHKGEIEEVVVTRK
ncbi:14399_t:CDS:1, partial [Funneliformis geosporum]